MNNLYQHCPIGMWLTAELHVLQEGRVSNPAPIARRTPIQSFPEIAHKRPSPAAFARRVPLQRCQSTASLSPPPPDRPPVDRPMLGTKLPFQPAGGLNDIVRYPGGPATPDSLEHTPRRKGDAQLQPVEISVTPPVQHHRPGRFAVTTRTPGFLVVRLRRRRHGPMHHQTHVRLVDAEAERRGVIDQMRMKWGDLCAGCFGKATGMRRLRTPS